MGGFRCASEFSARFWTQVRPGGTGLGPGSPVARWWRVSGGRPSRDTPRACARRRSDLALRRCHVTIGRHALHLREPLWGFDSRWSTMSLSHPHPSRGGVLGRSRQPNGSLSLTALCDRTAASPAGVSGFPVAKCLPSGGRPPFCVPGDGRWRLVRARFGPPGVCRCGGCRIYVLRWSTGRVMPLAGGARRDAPLRGWWALRRVVGEIGVRIPAFAGMTGCERPE